MKVGDWVIDGEGEMGRITLYRFMEDWSLVQFKGTPMASMRRKSTLIPVDPAVGDILTAVNTNEEK